MRDEKTREVKVEINDRFHHEREKDNTGRHTIYCLAFFN